MQVRVASDSWSVIEILPHRQGRGVAPSSDRWRMTRTDLADDRDWRGFAAELGLRIHRLRVSKGLSQEAVAYRAGLTRFTYQRYERGEAQSGAPSNPTLRTLLALAQVFEVTLQDLVPTDHPDVTTR